MGYNLISTPAFTYQWQFNTIDIPGATNQSYTVTQSGYYTVIIADEHGCTSSTTEYIVISGIEDVIGNAAISIYPNPSNGNFMVEILDAETGSGISLEVVNALGQQIFNTQEKISSDHWKKEIDLNTSGVPPGVYFILIKTDHDFMRKKITVSR